MTVYILRQLKAGDKVTGLSLGDAEFLALKTYLRKKAKKHQDNSLARTYVFCPGIEPDKIVAYITLICGEIDSDSDKNGETTPVGIGEEAEYDYQHYPAIKLARLAVDKRHRKRELGKQLVDLVVGIAKDRICPAVGCRFVVVDAKKKSVSFYREKCGFTLLDTKENRAREEPVMFIDLHKA